VVEAWQFMPAGEREVMPAWIDPRWFHEDIEVAAKRTVGHRARPHMLIPTAAGTLRADLTDWIIRGVQGDVYPCKAEVFAATYEPAASQSRARTPANR
jgi:hypothetical protein